VVGQNAIRSTGLREKAQLKWNMGRLVSYYANVVLIFFQNKKLLEVDCKIYTVNSR
jgi:hypothetical protein